MRAKAVVFTDPGVVEVKDVDCPEPGPNDVVLALHHSWISTGTESSYLRGERMLGDTPRLPGDPHPFPIVPGYQKVGRVEWVGERIADIEIGEIVFAAVSRVRDVYELFSNTAGHVSPSVVDRSYVWRIPADQDPIAFAGLVLAQVGYNSGVRAPIGPGEPAVVVGDGLVGQWAAQTLALRGAEVVLLGRHPFRLQFFQTGQAHTTFDTSVESPLAWLDERYPDGVAGVVDTVGSIGTVEELATRLRRFGHIVSAGFYGEDDRLALQPLRVGEFAVDMVSGWDRSRMDATLRLIASGRLQTLPLITHRFPVAEAPEAWRMIMERTEPFLGVVFDW